MRTFRAPWRASRRQLVNDFAADMTDTVGQSEKELPCCCSPALAPLCLSVCLSAGLRSASRTDQSVFGGCSFLALPIAVCLFKIHLMHIGGETGCGK